MGFLLLGTYVFALTSYKFESPGTPLLFPFSLHSNACLRTERSAESLFAVLNGGKPAP